MEFINIYIIKGYINQYSTGITLNIFTILIPLKSEFIDMNIEKKGVAEYVLSMGTYE